MRACELMFIACKGVWLIEDRLARPLDFDENGISVGFVTKFVPSPLDLCG